MSSYPYNLGVLLEEILEVHASRPALCYSERRISFAELSDLVDRLGSLLLRFRLTRGDVIAIGNNKRPLSFALMLAALRLGVAYVNIDVASPVARNQRILQTSGARSLFHDDGADDASMSELARAQGCGLCRLTEEMLPETTAEQREAQRILARQVDGATIGYIMFTSGSTGVPKGVAVTHQNILHFIAWGRERFKVGEGDIFANLSPMYFDNSVFDFFVGLFSGAALCPVYRELLNDPYALTAHVARMACTIWFSVPSLLIYLITMKAFSAEGLPTLRVIAFGGEGYPKVELVKLYQLFSARASLVNVYGPTECTCICSAYTLTDEDFADLQGLPTLGGLNQNFDYRILDENDREASLGELCLIGTQVAAGYFNDPERTAASFFTLTDPKRYGKRMYRTGDLVREEAGRLHFVGRADNQIKHMGYRIEIEEIECALNSLRHVNQAAVVYQRTRSAYGKLIGFVQSPEALDDKSVLNELRRLLPEYMIPQRLYVLKELPKNANGKVDRRQLLASAES